MTPAFEPWQWTYTMRIRSRFLLWTNGALLLLWGLYLVVDEVSEREAMMRAEVRDLRCLASQVGKLGFSRGNPLPSLERTVSAVAASWPGTEVMVLDRGFRVIASSTAGRVGRSWHEQDIGAVLRGEARFVWKVKDHSHGQVPMLDITLAAPGKPGARTPAIHVARSLGAVDDKLHEQRLSRMVWALVSMVLMGVVISLVSHRWLLRPLGRVMQTLSGSRWFRPQQGRGDELQRLRDTVGQLVGDADAAVRERDALLEQVRSFNRKLERRIDEVKEQLCQAQAELVDKERLSAVAELAAGLAHELRTPMHIVRAAAELLAFDEANRQACQDIFEEVDRVSRFVDDLLLFARPVTADTEPVRLASVLRSAVDGVQRAGEEGQARIRLECPEELELAVDADHLRQVVVNLLSNAVAATPAAGTVRVVARCTDDGPTIAVEDDGPGIEAKDLQHLFSPFFTRRPGGTGLGLAIVRRLVDLYGGSVTVESTPGKGARFDVRFPDVLGTQER